MKKKAPKHKDFFHIGDILNDSMKSFRREADTEMMQIWNHWNSAVGKTISENAQPAAFKGSELVVHVSSSPWIQHLQFLKKDIIAKINCAIGENMIKTIKFKIGSV